MAPPAAPSAGDRDKLTGTDKAGAAADGGKAGAAPGKKDAKGGKKDEKKAEELVRRPATPVRSSLACLP